MALRLRATSEAQLVLAECKVVGEQPGYFHQGHVLGIDVQLRNGKNTLFLHSRPILDQWLPPAHRLRGEIPHLGGGCLPAYAASLTLLLGLPAPRSGLSLLYL